MQSQGLSSVLIVVGENQFVLIYEDGVYESVDDFFSVVKVVDIAVLILADPIHNLFLGELTAFQLQLQDTGFQRITLGFQILQTLFCGFSNNTLTDRFHHIAYVFLSCQQELQSLQLEIDNMIGAKSIIEDRLKEMKSTKRSKEVRSQIEKYCGIVADQITLGLNWVHAYAAAERQPDR